MWEGGQRHVRGACSQCRRGWVSLRSSNLSAAPPTSGSVDEGVEEQGVAHLVEHVTFLGSKKRETLLGTGAR